MGVSWKRLNTVAIVRGALPFLALFAWEVTVQRKLGTETSKPCSAQVENGHFYLFFYYYYFFFVVVGVPACESALQIYNFQRLVFHFFFVIFLFVVYFEKFCSHRNSPAQERCIMLRFPALNSRSFRVPSGGYLV